jgi:hypothetical protein
MTPNEALERRGIKRRGPQLDALSRQDKLGVSCRVRVPVGSTVIVVLREDDEPFELTPEDEPSAVIESIAVIERGELVSGEQFLEQLRRFG